MDTSLHQTLNTICSKAAEFRDSFGDEARARALEWAASQVERAIHDDDDQRLTLSEAALRSGYSADHLARLIREGRVPNAGRPGSPRLRVADLPDPSAVSGCWSTGTVYDPVTDARQLRGRR